MNKQFLTELHALVANNAALNYDSTIRQACEILRLPELQQTQEKPIKENTIGLLPILDIFAHAKEHGKEWPVLNLGTNYKLTLQTNRKGQINLTNGERYGSPLNTWYGRIEKSGAVQWQLNLPGNVQDEIYELLEAFQTDPAAYAKILGMETFSCLFCNRELSHEYSKDAGYGPDCADTYGLPWGNA